MDNGCPGSVILAQSSLCQSSQITYHIPRKIPTVPAIVRWGVPYSSMTLYTGLKNEYGSFQSAAEG
jgi:hypothetical protein